MGSIPVTITSPDGSTRTEDGRGNVTSRTSTSQSVTATTSKVYIDPKTGKKTTVVTTSTPTQSTPTSTKQTLPEGAQKVGRDRIRYNGATYDEQTFYAMQARGQRTGVYDDPNKAEIVYKSKLSGIVQDEYAHYDAGSGEIILDVPKDSEAYSYLSGIIVGQAPKNYAIEERAGGAFFIGKYDYSTGQSGYTIVKQPTNPLANKINETMGIKASSALDFEKALGNYGVSTASKKKPSDNYVWISPGAKNFINNENPSGIKQGPVEGTFLSTERFEMRQQEKAMDSAIRSGPLFPELRGLSERTAQSYKKESAKIPIIGEPMGAFATAGASTMFTAPEEMFALSGKIVNDVSWRLGGEAKAKAAIANQAEDIGSVGAFIGGQAALTATNFIGDPIGTTGSMAYWGATSAYPTFLGYASWGFVGKNNMRAVAEAMPSRGTMTSQFSKITGQQKGSQFTIDTQRPVQINQKGVATMGETTARSTTKRWFGDSVSAEYKGTFEQVSFNKPVTDMQFYQAGKSFNVAGYGKTQGYLKVGNVINPTSGEYYLGPTQTTLTNIGKSGLSLMGKQTPASSLTYVGTQSGVKLNQWFGSMMPVKNTLSPTISVRYAASGVSSGGYFPYTPIVDQGLGQMVASNKYLVKGTSFGYGASSGGGYSYVFNPFSKGGQSFASPFPKSSGGALSGGSGGGMGNTMTQVLRETKVITPSGASAESLVSGVTQNLAKSKDIAFAGGIGEGLGNLFGMAGNVKSVAGRSVAVAKPKAKSIILDMPAPTGITPKSGNLLSGFAVAGPKYKQKDKPISPTGINLNLWDSGLTFGGTKSGQKQKGLQLQPQKPDVTPIVGVEPISDTFQPIETKPIQAQPIITDLISDTPYPPGGTTPPQIPFIEPPSTPGGGGFNFGLSGFPDFGGTMSGGGRQIKGYTPSLGAILGGATTKKAPKGMVGLEMRPMVGKKKKKGLSLEALL